MRDWNDKAKYNQVNDEQQSRIDYFRDSMSDIYDTVGELCKPGRETSLALTKLEEAQMWAIKGITRESQQPVEDNIRNINNKEDILIVDLIACGSVGDGERWFTLYWESNIDKGAISFKRFRDCTIKVDIDKSYSNTSSLGKDFIKSVLDKFLEKSELID